MNLRIRAERETYTDAIALHIALEFEDGFSVAEPISFKHLEQGAIAPSCMALKQTDAQRLMDELWNVGLRPSEGSGSAGQLAAVQNHLEDMRTIAMSQLGIA